MFLPLMFLLLETLLQETEVTGTLIIDPLTGTLPTHRDRTNTTKSHKTIPMMTIDVSLRVERLLTDVAHVCVSELLLVFGFDPGYVLDVRSFDYWKCYLIGYGLVRP